LLVVTQFGNCCTLGISGAVRVAMEINVERNKRGRGIPKERWMDIMDNDTKKVGVSKDEAKDRALWGRCRTREAEKEIEKKKIYFRLQQRSTTNEGWGDL